MGEAKRKSKQSAAMIEKINSLDLPRISTAIKKLAVAASEGFAKDCYFHALFCKTIMQRYFQIDLDLVMGFAAWRVGDGDGDVILHAPATSQIQSYQIINYEAFQAPNAFPYHAWLECGTWILDFTTYQLPAKASALDAIDGQHTQVIWCPDYLWINKRDLKPLGDVIQKHMGISWYERVIPVENMLKTQAKNLDEEDFELFMAIYLNPDIAVIGPNHVKAMFDN